MPGYVFYDINARDPFVSDSKEVMLEDTKVVIQGLWRLLTTEQGEIPNFRNYGLNIKRFCQYPMSKATASAIYTYIKNQIEAFEQRVNIVSAKTDANFEQGTISFNFLVQIKETGDTVSLPTFTVNVGGNN